LNSKTKGLELAGVPAISSSAFDKQDCLHYFLLQCFWAGRI